MTMQDRDAKLRSPKVLRYLGAWCCVTVSPVAKPFKFFPVPFHSSLSFPSATTVLLFVGPSGKQIGSNV